MSLLYPDGRKRAIEYAGSTDIIQDELGSGTDGIVFSTTRTSAIKVYRDSDKFEKELAAYMRLKQHGVTYIRGHAVPELVDFDRSRLVIEMSWVKPPYILDFAKTSIDSKTDFGAEQEQWWIEQVHERFGRNAGAAWFIHQELWEKYGIFYHDMKPENIRFVDED